MLFRIPVAGVVGQTGMQGGVPAAVRVTDTRKAHGVAVALVDRQLNDRVVCSDVQVRRLHTHTHTHTAYQRHPTETVSAKPTTRDTGSQE